MFLALALQSHMKLKVKTIIIKVEACIKKYYDPITTDMDQNSDCVNKHTPVFV